MLLHRNVVCPTPVTSRHTLNDTDALLLLTTSTVHKRCKKKKIRRAAEQQWSSHKWNKNKNRQRICDECEKEWMPGMEISRKMDEVAQSQHQTSRAESIFYALSVRQSHTTVHRVVVFCCAHSVAFISFAFRVVFLFDFRIFFTPKSFQHWETVEQRTYPYIRQLPTGTFRYDHTL